MGLHGKRKESIMIDLEKLGIVKGQTVTADLLKSLEGSDLPEAALSELWVGRTINKIALYSIDEKIALAQVKAKPKKEKVKDGE